MGEPQVVQSIPDCDLCAKEDIVRPSIVDAMTESGALAYMCDPHRKRWSVGRHLPPGEHPDEAPLVIKTNVGTPETAKDKAAYTRDAIQPSYAELVNMLLLGPCLAVDGCECAPGGHCSHGLPSWFVALGIATG